MLELNGWSARSLNVEYFRCGSRNVSRASSTVTAGDAAASVFARSTWGVSTAPDKGSYASNARSAQARPGGSNRRPRRGLDHGVRRSRCAAWRLAATIRHPFEPITA